MLTLYFMHALKWKEVSTLYYALPVSIWTLQAAIKSQTFFSSALTWSFRGIWLGLFSKILHSKERSSSIYIYCQKNHWWSSIVTVTNIKNSKQLFSVFLQRCKWRRRKYRYLIFYNNKNVRDSKSLLQAVKYIVQMKMLI
jgi:hypothetical protein